MGGMPSIAVPKQNETVLDLTFLKFAVHAQEHRSDLLLATNNGFWCVLAAGDEKIEAATRTLTPIVEKWKYNELANREFNLTDTIAQAVEWMVTVGNECFHVIMELPVLGHVSGKIEMEEGELNVMYAMGVRDENAIRIALKNAKLL